MQAMTDSLQARRKRLLFRAVRRGTKEADLVIGGFAKAHLGDLDADQLGRFEALLEENDPDVLAWIIGLQAPPADFDTDVLNLMKQFKMSS